VATHGDALGLLDDDIAKFEDIVFEQYFNGLEDGVLTRVQSKHVGDSLAVGKVAYECHEIVFQQVDIGIQTEGVILKIWTVGGRFLRRLHLGTRPVGGVTDVRLEVMGEWL
jgi:hypothetical protein